MIKFILLIGYLFSCFLMSSCKQEKLVNPEKSDKHYYSLDKKKILYELEMSPGDLRILWKRDYKEIPCDISTFEVLSPLFSKDKDAAYFKYTKIEGADAQTTYYDSINEVLKDQHHVFTMNHIGQCMTIADAKPQTFQYLDTNSRKWAKDQYSYFYFNKKLPVDYETFQILSQWFALDKRYLYISLSRNDSLPSLHEYNEYIKPFAENIVYDKDSIFYVDDRTWPPLLTVFSYENINTLKSHNKKNTIISFDGKVYRNGEVVANADANTYSVISELYSKDAYKVYFGKIEMENSDPATFIILHESNYYSKDKANVYFREKILENGNPKNFKIIESPYSTDGKNVYFREKRIDGADPESFKIVYNRHNLSKDNNYVYYKDNIVPNAVPSKFKSNKASIYESGKYKWKWNPGGNEEDSFDPIN